MKSVLYEKLIDCVVNFKIIFDDVIRMKNKIKCDVKIVKLKNISLNDYFK